MKPNLILVDEKDTHIIERMRNLVLVSKESGEIRMIDESEIRDNADNENDFNGIVFTYSESHKRWFSTNNTMLDFKHWDIYTVITPHNSVDFIMKEDNSLLDEVKTISRNFLLSMSRELKRDGVIRAEGFNQYKDLMEKKLGIVWNKKD